MISFKSILKNYYINKKIKYQSHQSKHWKIIYGEKFKKLKEYDIQNFRNNFLSKGLDDSFYSLGFKKKIYNSFIKEIGQLFLKKNLNKKNIGNLKNFFFFKNLKIDINELFHIYWLYSLKKKVKKKIKITCEIGGGYGSLAEKIIKNYECKYILIDLPETNILSSYYLSRNFPKKKIFFGNKKNFLVLDKKLLSKYDIFILTPQYSFDSLEIDLFINTRSFMEMESETVKNYFELIHKFISKDGFFLNINRYKKKTVSRPMYFGEYPYDKRWSVIYSEVSWMQKHCHHLLVQRLSHNSRKIEIELKKIKKISFMKQFIIDKILFKNLLPRFVYVYLVNLKRKLY
jgi:putative sugar O-methyltransferase|tara:strand:- start:42 stop:1073 length:1032 start_codon:yes stop_codon:yes gene_type:complete